VPTIGDKLFLIDPGSCGFGPALLAKMGQQQEKPIQALLSEVEKLVNEIRFVSDDAESRGVRNNSAKAVADVVLFEQTTILSACNILQ
jgi:hypothetical protein